MKSYTVFMDESRIESLSGEPTGAMYLNLVRAIPDIVYVLDDRGYFVFLNDAVGSLGFPPGYLVGKHFSEIIHPDDRAAVSREEVLKAFQGRTTGESGAPKLFDERRSGARMTRNLEVRLVGGEGAGLHYGSVNAYGEVEGGNLPFPGLHGKSGCTVGIIMDVTEARARERALKEALEARDILLKEVHHRVKNNLQVVSSLLSLHESEIADEESRKVFRDCRTQVQSMAMVHEALYRSESLSGVDMKPYLTRLAWYLSEIFEGGRRNIQTLVETDRCTLGVDQAVTLALIVNELVSNAYKYAFNAGSSGEIRISLVREGEDWVLRVQDRVTASSSLADPGSAASSTTGSAASSNNGSTASSATGKGSFHPGQGGIGNDLVSALATQLHGRLDRSNKDGTTVTLRFPL